MRSANRERGNEVLAYLRSRYVRYWPWFMLGALLGPLLAFAYLASIPATYRVSSTLLLPDAGAESAARPSAASLREEAEILTSPRLLERAVARLARRGSPQRTGGPAGPARAAPTAADYRRGLTVTPVGPAAAAVQLSLLTTAPEQGRAVVNQLVQVYSREHRQRRQRPVLDTIRNIDRRLRALAQAPAGPPPPVAADSIRPAAVGHPPLAVEAAAARNASRQLGIVAAQLARVDGLSRQLRPGSGPVVRNPGLRDPALTALLGQLNELRAERARLLRTAQPENPLVVDLDEQLADRRGQLLAHLNALKAGLVATRGALMARVGWLRPQARPVPAAAPEAPRPTRPPDARRARYQALLLRKAAATRALADTGAGARLLGPVVVTREPARPAAPVVYLLALLAGLVLPWGLVGGRDWLSDVVATPAAVGRRTSAPVLGLVGVLPPNELLVVAAHGTNPPAEAFHCLRHALLAQLAGRPSQVLLVGSGQPNEGQTVVALNLAASLGLVGKRVLVLDFNLRTPHLGRYVKLVVKAGISTYLSAKTLPLDPLLRQHGLGPNVSWLGSGPVPAHPAELLASERLAELFEELKPRFDHLILLTAPMGEAADAFALAPFVDASLFVLRLGHSRTAHVDLIEDIVQGQKLSEPVVVLNAGPA